MNCGDLVIAQKDNKKRIFIAYDKFLIVGAELSGLQLLAPNDLISDGYTVTLHRGLAPLQYRMRRRLNNLLLGLISKRNSLSLKERLNFDKYISYTYKTLLNIDVLDHPSITPSIDNFLQSKNLITVGYNEED